MIRPLRRRHRVSILILTLTIPALFAAGLLARKPAPTGSFPEALAAPAFESDHVLASQLKNTGTGLPLRIETLSPDVGSDRLRLSLQLLSDPKRPELLVYWTASPPPADATIGGIADDSFLLGALVGTAPTLLQLPVQASSEPGSLIFYSLAQQTIVDSVALRAPSGGAR